MSFPSQKNGRDVRDARPCCMLCVTMTIVYFDLSW